MNVILNYRMAYISGNQSIVKDFFEKLGKSVIIEGPMVNAFGEEETCSGDIEEIYLKRAIEDCKKLIPLYGADFVFEGTIDTSAAAGEYMDFQLAVQNGEIVKTKKSDWYLETCMESYSDYEEFCDCFYECTEEEYEKIKDFEFVYLIESENGDVLATEVPLKELTI